MDSFTFGTSTKGCPTVICGNFEYVKFRENKNGQTYWRCKMFQRFKCKAHLTTEGDRIVTNNEQGHTHEGNIATSLARKAVAEMKNKMGESSSTPAAVIGSISRRLDNHVLMALPKRSTLTRTLQRRRAILADNENEVVLPQPPADTNFTVPPRFVDMILYDSGAEDEDRILILGCPELLDGLARAKLWLADGTFAVVPSIFFQLYSIHFELCPGNNPVAVYCLVRNKQRSSYERILAQMKIMIPAANPERILVDFETAAMSAFQAAYPNAVISGCYFHLCQSVLRKVNDIGMKQEYETNNAVCGSVRCLAALALVPEVDVIEAFDLLADDIADLHERMPELLSYFEHTYIRGRRRAGQAGNYGPSIFPVHRWNQHQAAGDGIARTTNAVEGWHYGLQTLFQCHHPTLWKFLDGISKDMQNQKATFLQGLTGVQQIQRKKYRELKERVARAVGLYLATDVLQYLRAMAHLSHQ